MATKKKKTTKSSNSRLRRIHQIVQENTVESIAIVSIFLNLFFIIGLVLFQTSPAFEKKVFKYTYEHYCLGDSALQYDKENTQEVAFYEVMCKQGDFTQYWNQALQEYDSLKIRQQY